MITSSHAQRSFTRKVGPPPIRKTRKLKVAVPLEDSVPFPIPKLYKKPWYRTEIGIYLLVFVGLFIMFLIILSGILAIEKSGKMRNVLDYPGTGIKWGEPFVIWCYNDTRTQRLSRFEITFCDAWYVEDSLSEEKERDLFAIAFTSKNLGPREKSFYFGNLASDFEIIEVRTSNGFIFPDANYRLVIINRFEDWQEKETSEIGGVTKGLLLFSLPKGEIPVELFIDRCDIDSPIRVKIPRQTFPTKKPIR